MATARKTTGCSRRVDSSRLDVAFDRIAQAVGTGVMPSAVMAVATGDRVVRCAAMPGTGGPPAGPDSIYMLASISKAITATAVMRMVDDGLIVLSAPVARYVPEFAAAGKAEVTVWHLLTHTSGLVDEGIGWRRWRRDRILGPDILASVCAADLDFEPGTRFHYYTGSFWVLAEAVTRLSGIAYPDYMRERIFRPLGMNDTAFDPWAAGHGDRVIVPAGMTDDGVATSSEVTRYFAGLAWPGVGLCSTVGDLIKLGQTLLKNRTGGGIRLLSPAAVELMSREHTTGINKIDEHGCSQPVRYGLTWRKGTFDGRATLPGSAHIIEHDGAFGTWLWIDPDYDLVFAILTNQWQQPFDGPQAAALAAVYSALVP